MPKSIYVLGMVTTFRHYYRTAVAIESFHW